MLLFYSFSNFLYCKCAAVCSIWSDVIVLFIAVGGGGFAIENVSVYNNESTLFVIQKIGF